MAVEYRKVQKSKTGSYVILPQKMMEQTGTNLDEYPVVAIAYDEKNKYKLEFINPLK